VIGDRVIGDRVIADQKDVLRPNWTRVVDPRPCATAMFMRRNAAESHSDPPYPCFNV
jgi:hypothetical protein